MTITNIPAERTESEDHRSDVRSVAAALRRRAGADPSSPFVKCGGEWLTSREMDEMSDRVAGGLAALGVTKGDRVAMLMPNREEALQLLFGCAKLGACLVPLNIFLRGESLAYQLADSGARVLIADAEGCGAAAPVVGTTAVDHVLTVDGNGSDGRATGGFADLLAFAGQAPSVETVAGDLMSIIYTSGTTGPAKGCMLSHGYYTSFHECWAERGWVVPDDRIFTSLPLFHTGGHLVMMFALMLQGASACFEPAFSASTYMERAAEENATCLFGIGTLMAAILQQEPRPSDGSHRFRVACFPPSHPDAQVQFEQRFGTPVIAEGMGQTECTASTLDYLDRDRRPGLNGTPCAHLEVDVVDEHDRPVAPGVIGEMVVRPRRPHTIYSGYWNNPAATAKAWRNLWHHTGDYFTRQENGHFVFVDRKNDAIRRRGENISSFEVEGAISRHPLVAQVAICAVPSDLDDVDVKASLVLVPGAETTPAELFRFFRDNLPYFAVPRYVEVREGLPLTAATNRVQKHVLREEGVHERMWDLTALGFVIDSTQRRRQV